ncbi:hypothetical protein ACFXPK_24695, partial [Streptomyces sp. NPDC059142]
MTTITSRTPGAPDERSAARAYLRLLAAVRAVLDDPVRAPQAAPRGAAPLGGGGAGGTPGGRGGAPPARPRRGGGPRRRGA